MPRGLDVIEDAIIRAKDEAAARVIASNTSLDEGPEVWMDEELSTCNRLIYSGDPDVILQSGPGF